MGVALLVGGCVQLQQPLVNGGSKLGANREISIQNWNPEGFGMPKGKEAFNGTAINFREDGAKSSETPYVEGKRHGPRLVIMKTDRRCLNSPTWTAKAWHGDWVPRTIEGGRNPLLERQKAWHGDCTARTDQEKNHLQKRQRVSF